MCAAISESSAARSSTERVDVPHADRPTAHAQLFPEGAEGRGPLGGRACDAEACLEIRALCRDADGAVARVTGEVPLATDRIIEVVAAPPR